MESLVRPQDVVKQLHLQRVIHQIVFQAVCTELVNSLLDVSEHVLPGRVTNPGRRETLSNFSMWKPDQGGFVEVIDDLAV